MSYLKNKLQEKAKLYLKRKIKINEKIKSLAPEARLIVNRTNMYLKVQIIDAKGNVAVMVSDKAIAWATKSEKAGKLGEEVAKMAKEKGITKIAFDRNGYLYHGKIKALAEGLRKGWLQF